MRRGKVKKILKKNQVIITSLAVLIAIAGYLNFADVDLGLKNKEASADSSSILEDVDYDLTDETAVSYTHLFRREIMESMIFCVSRSMQL